MSADPSARTSSNGARSNGAGPAGEGRTLRLGGMALRNGLLIHGPTSWAVAVRAPDGTIEVGSGPKPIFARGRLGSVPLLRGPLRLAEALAVIPLVRLSVGAARLPLEDRSVVAAAIASTAASGALRRVWPPTVGREAAVAVLGALPAVTALRDRDLAAYHGVEHKAIGGYESGTDPTEVPKEHQRCGSNLIAPMLALSIIGQVAAERLARKPGPVTRALAAAGGVGIAVELFAFAERNPDSVVGRAVHGPGHEIQRRFSTREPTAEQLEVGVAALSEVLRAEGQAADPPD
ncbi:MAG: DUF1385 domain-containing protein [Solirubrobacterales bacterium]|nr:DUF1385 domain-containing protein [Solirubrobacterales bacterium]